MVLRNVEDGSEENVSKKRNIRLYALIAVCVLLIILIALLVVFLSSERSSISDTVMLIDQDGGADDAMAIFIALLQEKYFNGPKVIAISTVHGNVNESQVFTNVQRILDVAERQDIPIYRGTTSALVISYESDYFFGRDGLGDSEDVKVRPIMAQPQHAVFALIELSKKYKDRLVIVALAPLTNIAMAQKIDPEFISRLKHLYVGAGNINGNNVGVEFNVQLDVEAYKIVTNYSMSNKVTILPFSEMRKSINTTTKWREDTLGAIKTKIMQAQNSYEQVSIVQSNRWQILDPIVMSTLYAKDMVTSTQFSDNSVILCGSDRGINTNDFSSNEANTNIIMSMSQSIFEQFLLDTFSADQNVVR